MADDLAKKAVVRRGLRGVVTKRLDEVDAVLGSGGDPDKAKLARLKLALEEKMAALKRLDEEIVTLTQDEEEVITAIEEADDYSQSVYERLVQLDAHLAPSSSASVAHGSQAKLPKLNLPTFCGDVTTWTAFWDSYEAAVHKNTQLSDVQRFTYLRSLVKEDTIAGLALTSANYAEAITLLCERFGNKERIIAKHMEALLSLTAVTRQHDTKALRALYDKVETNVRELKALGVDEQAYNLLLPSVVMKCLPSELRLSVSRKLPESEWKLDKIMKELNEELKARERAASEFKYQDEEQRRRRNPASGTSASLFTGQACSYCNQSHLSDACTKVVSVEARKHFLRQSNRCFICLKRGHISRVCRRNSRCSHCGDKHHVSICYRKESSAGVKNYSSDSSKPSTSSTTRSLDPKAESFKTASLFTDNSGSILLQTATAPCYNLDDSSIRVSLRLAFDSGSQRSYITKKASRKLHLKPVGSNCMRITSFGNIGSKGQICEVVRVGIETKECSERGMTLCTVPVICEPLSGTSLERSVQRYQYLQGLDLADAIDDGGFNLTKFICNREILNSNELWGVHKVLGVSWDVDNDYLIIDLKEVVNGIDESYITKRKIVGIASKIFDPIGIASPITIQAKLLFQRLHCAKMGWDDIVEGDLLKRWLSLLRTLKESEPICVPRWYQKDMSIGENVKWSLHGFSDASTRAYAAVVYLQCWSGEERKSVFVASKSRVAPVNEQTVPRLELLGALLLARLIKTVYSALESEILVTATLCYTDSQVALCWIRGEDKDWKPFIQNRVSEIRSLVPASYWRHCRGRNNPADIPTRGSTTKELVASNLWFYGPSWLSEIIEEDAVPGEIPEACVMELRVADRKTHSLLVSEVTISKMMDLKNYSSLERLCRVTGLVLKFVKILKQRVGGGASATLNEEMEEEETSVSRKPNAYTVRVGGCASAVHTILIQKSEELWIIDCQKSLIQSSKFQVWQKQFQLFQDSRGIWRCRGRLKNADLPSDTKHPIILPGKHYFTELIIRRGHERVYHNGVKEPLTEVRSRYWILRGRAAVRYYIHRCIVCRKAEGRSYGGPIPPPLPSFRVSEEPPFTYTGVDFAGPLFVKGGNESESKVYLCLFTCCVTRAIHLDVVHNLSVEFFIRCLKRFIARRGLPRKIVSDNAKTFKSTARIIRKLMNHPDIDRYLSDHRMIWSFNLERAPWWGGVFERLIRSVKRCLKKVIGRAKLTHEELITVVTEVEMIVNSRPLSYVSQEDSEEPITPSHLLIGRRVLSLPDSLCYEDDEDYNVTPQLLSNRLKHLNQLMNKFWKRWRSEYLMELRDAHRYHNSQADIQRVTVGDMVMIYSDSKKRGFWNMGRIVEPIIGQDGYTRGAVVRVYTGQGKAKLLRRSVKQLYPLEVKEIDNQPSTVPHEETITSEPSLPAEDSEDRDSQPSTEVTEVAQSIQSTRKSRRSAAVHARDRILAQSMD